MTQKIVLKRLKATIKKLRALPEEEFYYASYVRWCGTACCVAGWYPVWFPKAGLMYAGQISRYLKTENEGTSNYDIKQALMKYHGLSEKVINCLFYSSHKIDILEWTELRLKVGLLATNVDSKKAEVLFNFEQLYKYLKANL